jgi:hypothetical protein
MEPSRDLKVLALGLPRTGTLSLAHALRMLGYNKVHHTIDHPEEETWKNLSRAADATFSSLPTYTGSPFTKADWDAMYSGYEAVSECAALFSPQLIDAYPKAKVVLVIRDFDKWYKSLDETLLVGLWSPLSYLFAGIIHPILGLTGIVTVRKLILGFFEASSPDIARQNARRIYDRHHQEIMKRVPKDMLLVYKMGHGWEPLCKFLDKPIPAEKFPWINEGPELKKATGEMLKTQLRQASRIVLCWCLGATCLALLCRRMCQA